MKTIDQYTNIELKALVYDHMANMEKSQEAIRIINAEIAKRSRIEPADTDSVGTELEKNEDKPKTS